MVCPFSLLSESSKLEPQRELPKVMAHLVAIMKPHDNSGAHGSSKSFFWQHK